VTTPSPPRRKKRVHPARKIVPRGRMGVGWIVAPVVLAALILIAGIALLAARVR
jgi:hypothetical protein